MVAAVAGARAGIFVEVVEREETREGASSRACSRPRARRARHLASQRRYPSILPGSIIVPSDDSRGIMGKKKDIYDMT